MDLVVFTDGASRGNPGEAGIGVQICKGQETIKEISEYIGSATNNVAEYIALKRGLEECIKLKGTSITVYMDSELIVKQLNGIYKVKNENLKEIYEDVKKLVSKFNKFEIHHVPRDKNKIADSLANKGIDEGQK